MQTHILNGRYQIEALLGQGGMAAVYRGRDLRLGRPVAIKLLHQHYAADDEFLQRFKHEALSAAHLSAHPNIVDVYDVGQDGAINYIVMELIEGQDLKALLRREGALPPARALAIAAQIADALDYAHRRGLVHRDVKPQNILVTPDGQVRITDFGIAKSHLSTAVTQTGITFGTADYISPEQAQGLPATPQSDIYSLGVTLYEMLTGQLPFQGANPMAVALQHIQQPPPPLRRFNPAIAPALEQIVLRLLAKDPQQRPASAAEVAQQLRDYLAGRVQPTIVAPAAAARAQPKAGQPTQPRQPAPQATPRRAAPPPRYVPPPLAAPPRERSGLGFGTLLIGLLLLSGILALAYLAFSVDLSSLLPGGGAITTATSTPAPTPTATAQPTNTPELVTVPEFVGQPEAAARQQLEALGLRLYYDPNDTSIAPRYSSQYPRGTIMAQDPPPGTQVLPGTPVKLIVSLGPQLVDVPDLQRAPFDEARDRLEGIGLRVERVDEPSRAIPPGFVIRQEPAGGVRLPQGATVRLVVSLGDVVRFPDVIANGTRREEAVRQIEAAGLRIVAIDEQGRDRLGELFDRFQPNEVVSATVNGNPIDQPGEYVPRGAEVVLGVRAP